MPNAIIRNKAKGAAAAEPAPPPLEAAAAAAAADQEAGEAAGGEEAPSEEEIPVAERAFRVDEALSEAEIVQSMRLVHITCPSCSRCSRCSRRSCSSSFFDSFPFSRPPTARCRESQRSTAALTGPGLSSEWPQRRMSSSDKPLGARRLGLQVSAGSSSAQRPPRFASPPAPPTIGVTMPFLGLPLPATLPFLGLPLPFTLPFLTFAFLTADD